MRARRSLRRFCGSIGLLLCALGGQRGSLQAAEGEPASVSVSRPVVREVTDCVDFTGRTQAVSSVNIVARVSGYLVKASFQEGSEVRPGDLLFEIDPRPYQAQYDLAVAQLSLSKSQLALARAALVRAEQVVRAAPAAVTAQQLEQDRAAVEQAEAQIRVAQAGLEPHRLNLDFCKVASPIAGLVGRQNLTPGNLAAQDKTVLTTVVSLDPIYACFDVDEATVLRVRRAIAAGQVKPSGGSNLPILMGLSSEEGFPHKGIVDFVNNQVDPATGTLLVRGVFSNPLPPGGPRLLLPGMFTRIRLPIGQPHQALLVADRAVCSDQGSRYVYVVNAGGEVQQKRVETGSLQGDALRVIANGLDAGDQVVVGGLRQVHPGVKVQTEVVPMPLRVDGGAERSKLPAGGKLEP